MRVATQVPPREYVIVVVPPIMPYTVPRPSTVATEVLLLVQVPPPGRSLNGVVVPAHNDAVPVISPGAALTVSVTDVVQPPKVYVIVEVPGVGPHTTVAVPETPVTVTTVLLLLQVPPPAASVSVLVALAHRLVRPPIGAGAAVTVIDFVTAQPEPRE
jgi:hypothetical protein